MQTNLVRVATYAKQMNKSLAWAYKQVNEKKVETTVIDTVIFVVTKSKKK